MGASETLPDCRAYEQVSPVNKGGAAAYTEAQQMPVQVSSSGEAISYLSFQGFPGAVGNTALYAAHVSTRTPVGWTTTDWTPALPKPEPLKLVYIFSEDLSHAVLQIPFIPFAPGATPFANNLYLRNTASEYSLLNTVAPARSIEEICPENILTCWLLYDESTFAGASSDFTRVMFESNTQAPPEAPLTSRLYESFAGKVHLVGTLPDGTPAESSTAGAGSSIIYVSGAQEADRSVERAVSRDGSHVIFQAPSDEGLPAEAGQAGLTEVYDRIDGGETVEVSALAAEATPAVNKPAPATFQTASIDGSRVFFTSSGELTTQSNTGDANNSEDLYEYDVNSKHLTDLTIDLDPKDSATGAMVQGVVDASADGSYIYFVADGQLTEGRGVDGQPNLYMVHNGSKPVFIATLDGQGSCSVVFNATSDSCNWSAFPMLHEAYVTPDGKHMAFMSTKSLPSINFPGGYDNVDQETAKIDTEVYEYSAPAKAEGTGQLLCASCDPTGAPPVGNALIGGISGAGFAGGHVPLVGIGTPWYRTRALSDDGGRLFYTAPASLVAANASRRPANSVYTYERDGEGDCTRAGGCQNLISGPDIGAGDRFLGASASGDDVYFATSSRLVSADLDNLVDVYDARTDGGIPEHPVEARCESQCLQASLPQADQLVATSAIGPSGNVALPPSPPPRLPTHTKKCKKHFKLSHRKCVKIKSAKRRRAVARRSARRSVR